MSADHGGGGGTAGSPPVPTGLEQLLRLAAADAGFRKVLAEQRGTAADAAGVALTTSERAILASIGEAQLAEMVAHVPPPAPDRRGFLRNAAASAVVLLGGAAVSSCDACEPTVRSSTAGVQPDMPPERPLPETPHERPGSVPVPQGIQPEVPPPPERPEAPQPTRGIRSDVPHERPTVRESAAGGGAAPDMPIGIGGLRSTEE